MFNLFIFTIFIKTPLSIRNKIVNIIILNVVSRFTWQLELLMEQHTPEQPGLYSSLRLEWVGILRII